MRMQTNGAACFVIISALLVSGTVLLAAAPDPEFLAAKTAFFKEMKKKDPSARAAAVSVLAEVTQKETVEILLKRGLSDDHSSVHAAVRKGLRQLASDQAVSQFMLDDLKKQLRKPAGNETPAVELLRALVTTNDEERQSEIVKFIDEFLASPKANALIPMLLIDDFGLQGDAEAVRSVELLAKVNAFESRFGYRRCVVQAMSQIRQPEAVDFLIDLLPKTKGLIQFDVIDYLTRLTGQKFQDQARNWAEWWKANQSTFTFPPAGKPLPEITADDTQPTYYRIPICAKRIVFVLDTSGSMRGPPIDAAKQALLKTIESLPEAVSFDVVMFDATATSWRPRLVAATREAKEEASRTVIDRGLNLGTVSSSALNVAFHLEPEAIYFLSDGEPTDGAPNQIVDFYTQLNKSHRISIHTIGVVTQRFGGVGLTSFMQPLAERNYGKFRLVE